MKINKMQAIYKYLPNAWTIYSDREEKEYFSARILSWNTKPVIGIYKTKILQEIKRQIHYFQAKGGNVDDFYNLDNPDVFDFVEAAMNENNLDINVKIEPEVFYCRHCGLVQRIAKNLTSPHFCTACGKRLVQLQMVYSCECGYSAGVSVKYPSGITKVYYRPNKGARSNFKFTYNDGNEKNIEFIETCPNCKTRLLPKNAIDKINFVPFSTTNVNLIDKETGSFLERGEKAYFLIVARLLNILSKSDYDQVVKFYDRHFNYIIDDDIRNKAEQLVFVSNGSISMERAIEILSGSIQSNKYIDIIQRVRNLLINIDYQNIDLLASQYIEYLSLKDSKKIVEFDYAKKQSIKNETVSTEEEMDEINHLAKIKNVQLSSDVEIINSVYGYTRITNNPVAGKNNQLKSFFFNKKYNIFTATLNTEGLLIEISSVAIVKWLTDNNIIDNPDLMVEEDARLWLINNMNVSLINHFSEISGHISDETKVTKYVYGLLHTISHLFMKSAGKYSGLDKDSMAELIMPSVPAIFIYATTIQGLTLGSLSSMFEQNYYYFVMDAVKDNEVCTFDPICSEHQGSSCFACTHISDISCTHFNHDLSRAYLFGGHTKHNGYDVVIKKGFWK